MVVSLPRDTTLTPDVPFLVYDWKDTLLNRPEYTPYPTNFEMGTCLIPSSSHVPFSSIRRLYYLGIISCLVLYGSLRLRQLVFVTPLIFPFPSIDTD